ncbi:hypothetical protein K501DRAFT_275715 [Backusella circina FSU 941]|nr:hypothetical protein K501DRAFT_275715 [Backusella circina FSU 941]
MSVFHELDDNFYRRLPSLISDRRLKMAKFFYDNNEDNNDTVRKHGSPILESGVNVKWETEEFSVLDASSLLKEEQVKPKDSPFPWMSLCFFVSFYIYYYHWSILKQLIQKLCQAMI